MTDQTHDAPSSGAPGGQPPAGEQQNQAARPEWLPEPHWDAQANSIKPEFGQHYSELATFHKTENERQAALKARKPEDIKIEVKLPPEVKVPDGMQLKIDEKDPRVPIVRQIAQQFALPQEAVDALVAFDAQQQLAAHSAEIERVAAEDKKLGENVKERKEAASNWAKALRDKGEFSADEYAEISVLTATAAGVTLLEKLIAKSNGTVPGTGGNPPPPPREETTVEQRWYGQKG